MEIINLYPQSFVASLVSACWCMSSRCVDRDVARGRSENSTAPAATWSVGRSFARSCIDRPRWPLARSNYRRKSKLGSAVNLHFGLAVEARR